MIIKRDSLVVLLGVEGFVGGFEDDGKFGVAILDLRVLGFDLGALCSRLSIQLLRLLGGHLRLRSRFRCTRTRSGRCGFDLLQREHAAVAGT